MLIRRTFSERKTRLIGTVLPFHWLNVRNVSKNVFETKNAFNRKPFLPFHWLNVKTFRKKQLKTLFEKPVYGAFRFSFVFVDKKKKNAATTVVQFSFHSLVSEVVRMLKMRDIFVCRNSN